MEDLIENKIANSGLITFDLGDLYDATPIQSIDIKPWLFHEMILKEKDFRKYLLDHNWEQYQDSYVCFYNSAEAIIPNWAWMLISSYLEGNCKRYYNGTPSNFNEILYSEKIQALDSKLYQDKRILIKGCSDKDIPNSAYSMITSKLLPIAKSIMFGEACSNVPIFKQKANKTVN